MQNSKIKMQNNKKTVFIVDDDEFILDIYTVKFKELGYNVEIAISGDEALEKIKKGFEPDIILLDVVMPQMDGFELLRNIREDHLVPKAKIIILTNLGQKKDIDKGVELKADDYVVKAYFTPAEIAEKVKEVLET